MLSSTLDQAFDMLHEAVTRLEPRAQLAEVGTLLEIAGGIARVRGLPGIGAEELVSFPGGVQGLTVNLDPDELGIVLLSSGDALIPGMQVHATGRQADTPVGNDLIGRVIDATGRPLDGKGPLSLDQRRPVERPAPGIMERAPVSVPLETGIKAVDAMIPIGRGQRELIVGDRQTGKTTVAVDTIINQRDKDVL
jgi:F-type H+-transporting ATPase subunit alpha